MPIVGENSDEGGMPTKLNRGEGSGKSFGAPTLNPNANWTGTPTSDAETDSTPLAIDKNRNQPKLML
jgi:hypothetical protein